MKRGRPQSAFRIVLGIDNIERLQAAAARRGQVPQYLLERMVNLVLREGLVDAVMDDAEAS